MKQTFWLIELAAIALAGLLFSGCVLTPQQAASMTPEQIKAWSDANADVYACFSVLGPPPNGAVTVMVLPKGKKLDLTMAPNCQLQQGKIVEP